MLVVKYADLYKCYFNLQLVTGVSVELYFPQCWFVFPASQYLQVLVSGLEYKEHVIIKHNNKNTNTMYIYSIVLYKYNLWSYTVKMNRLF